MVDSATKRHFTVEEANTALDLIRPLVRQLLEIRQAILARQPEVWPALAKIAGNGGGKVPFEVEQEFQRLDACMRQILAIGVEVKDANVGLVDFPALREGREVYLCWQYGEEKVAYWHEIDGGFAGRQQI